MKGTSNGAVHCDLRLYPFREGKNPFKKEYTEEEKKAMADRFKKKGNSEE